MPKKTEPKDTQSAQPEQVQQIRISDIRPFKNHPFKVVDDALMQETVDSIMQFGVLNPTEYSQNAPSLSQAQRLKKLSREGKCTQDAMYAVMSEEKKEELDRVTLKSDTRRWIMVS